MTNPTGPQGSAEDFVQNLTHMMSAFGLGNRSGLQPEEKNLILQYRVVHELLGNYGRYGATDRALITSPEISPDTSKGTSATGASYTLTFVEVLPKTTTKILLRYPKHETSYQIVEVDPKYWELSIDDPGVISVKVEDIHKDPLAMGIATGVAKAKHEVHTTTVTGERITERHSGAASTKHSGSTAP
jgi:hypothetical protein